MSSQPVSVSNSAVSSLAPPPQQITQTNGSIFNTVNSKMATSSANQNCLTTGNCNKTGGKRYKSKGGASTMVAPPLYNPVPDGGTSQTNANNITKSTVAMNVNSGFDACAGKGAGCTTGVEASQQQILNGGRKKGRGSSKRGGSWPKWGCMSGGKKSRTGKKSRKNKGKSKKTNKTHNKSRKHKKH
jgi:hypothetical protein